MWLAEMTLRFAASRGATSTAQGLPLVRLVLILLIKPTGIMGKGMVEKV